MASTDSLTPGQVAALLQMVAITNLPGDGEVVTADNLGEFLSPVVSVEADKPCAVPCKNGLFSKVFYLAKFNGRCWLCGENEIRGRETLIANWGCGWVSFGCFCRDALLSTTVDMLEKQDMTTRFVGIFDHYIVTYPRIVKFWRENTGVDISSNASYLTFNNVRTAVRIGVKNFADLRIFLNEIEGTLL